MKFLHIFPVEKFTEGYISFVNDNFDSSEHLFLLVKAHEYYPKYADRFSNVIYLSGDFRNNYLVFTKQVMKRNVEIYLHSMFLSDKYKLILFLLLRIKKLSLTWIVWGGDLYYSIKLKKQDKKTIRERRELLLYNAIIIKCKTIATLVKGDYELLNKHFAHFSNYKKAVYINPVKTDFLKSPILQSEKDELIRIQIGNSASSTNNHEEIFCDLKKFKDENIEIYCPLSYGDENYANQIALLGKNIFGNKFIPMTEFINPKEYSNFILKMDILIMNNNRQQGLGNISAYATLGKKIFVRSDVCMWQYLQDECSLKIFDTKNIQDLNFSGFKEMKPHDSANNSKKANYYFYSQDYLFEVWSSIFEQ